MKRIIAYAGHARFATRVREGTLNCFGFSAPSGFSLFSALVFGFVARAERQKTNTEDIKKIGVTDTSEESASWPGKV